MSSAKNRRAKRQTERRARPPAPAANMRFGCPACGFTFEVLGSVIVGPMSITNEDTGETINGVEPGIFHAACPRCGQTTYATNQFSASQGKTTVTGFADTPAQRRRIVDAIAELEALEANASFEQVVEVLERQEELKPLAGYLRENRLALAGLGVGLIGVVIALLAWLFPVGQDQPPVPDGITHEQMEDLIREIRARPTQHGHGPASKSDDGGHEQHRHPRGTEGDRNR